MDFIDYFAFSWLALIGIVVCKAGVDSARFQILYRKISGNPRFPILAGEIRMFPRTKSGIVDPLSIIYTRRMLQVLYATHEDPRLNSLARMVRTEFHWGLALVPVGFLIFAVLVFASKPTG